MMDWIGADGEFHAVVNGQSACGAHIGGSAAASHACESCLFGLFTMLENVPGFETEDA